MKPKRAPQSKEQILNDLRRKKEVARKRAIVVDQFYPQLVGTVVSIDEAKMLISSITNVMMEQVLGWMKERKFSDIMPVVLTRLCPDGERLEEVTKLLKIVEGENIFVAREIVEGMGRAIEQMINDELKSRFLETLKPDWDKMLN